jgi:hypothetical protein
MLNPEPFSDIPQIQLAYNFLQRTGCHIFLTGKAGTGKTTFLKRFREETSKRMIVTAPTGVAAINAGGVTIHSFFQLPFGPQVLAKGKTDSTSGNPIDMNRFSREKIQIIRQLDLLVIDEISMVRADLLDAVDRVLRRYRKRQLPFGGLQVLMIGDIRQLAPVVNESDWALLKEHYPTPYFFSSKVLRNTQYVTIELQHIFRQRDERFIRILNQVRENSLDASGIELLNSRYKPGFDPDNEEGYITLTTHNQQARLYNERKLNAIDAPSVVFCAEVSGVFPEYSYPTDVKLELKPGAQVMFARNDVSREKRFYNGKIGTLVSIDEEVVTVLCPDGDLIETGAVEWHNYTYSIDPETEEIRETLLGTFKQIPLKLAWAITIHKSQGLTFNKVVIDAHAAFAHGQVYVALSRCTGLEGMVLRTPVDPKRLDMDPSVKSFLQDLDSNQPNEQTFEQARVVFMSNLLHDLFDFLPMRLRLDQCTKLVRENESLIGVDAHRVCRELTKSLRDDVMEVARKFTRQIDGLLHVNPDAETNEVLQERLVKSCAYFEEKLLFWRNALLDELELKSGNKAVRKGLTDCLDKLEEELYQKLSMLHVLQNGFDTMRLLSARTQKLRGVDCTPLSSVVVSTK